MKLSDHLICPKCGSSHFTIKREATYLYTYNLETPDTENWSTEDEALPFLFDNREQLDNKEFLECSKCKAKYTFDFDDSSSKIHLTILQKAIRSDLAKNPGFLG